MVTKSALVDWECFALFSTDNHFEICVSILLLLQNLPLLCQCGISILESMSWPKFESQELALAEKQAIISAIRCLRWYVNYFLIKFVSPASWNVLPVVSSTQFEFVTCFMNSIKRKTKKQVELGKNLQKAVFFKSFILHDLYFIKFQRAQSYGQPPSSAEMG